MPFFQNSQKRVQTFEWGVDNQPQSWWVICCPLFLTRSLNSQVNPVHLAANKVTTEPRHFTVSVGLRNSLLAYNTVFNPVWGQSYQRGLDRIHQSPQWLFESLERSLYILSLSLSVCLLISLLNFCDFFAYQLWFHSSSVYLLFYLLVSTGWNLLLLSSNENLISTGML